MKRKLRNISWNAPQCAVVFFSIIIGLAMVVPVYMLFTYALQRSISALPAGDVEEFKHKLFIVSVVLVFGVGPIMTAFTKTKQYRSLRLQKGETFPKRRASVSASTTKNPIKAAPKRKRLGEMLQDNQGEVKESKGEVKTDTEDNSDSIPVFEPAVNITTTFDDIAGYEQTKKNMEFIVKCLQRPELLREIGAKIPAGILLYGPPGTGKTLMAKAIAGAANVNFYSAKASEFVNLWVGQGARNVRALYQAAKANVPSIVFIDELDAIGGKRTSDQNQEYRQTLNALLTEIDGMDKESGVLTIAATNDFENLDSALIRPGRFDRKVIIPLPNVVDRKAIIELHAGKLNLAAGVSIEKLVKETVGMSGSAIATLFNEAAIRAVMADRNYITEEDLDSAITQMITNGEVVKAANAEDLRIAAYHEAGHAIIMRLLAHDTVQKVSIIGSTIGAVGMTLRVENEERLLIPVETIKARVVAAYGGRAAEELIFGKENVTTGARQDIKDASAYIREYLECGAGGSLLHESAFAGGRVAPDMQAAKTISIDLYNEALKFLSEHRETLDRVAQVLLEKESLMEEELEELLQL